MRARSTQFIVRGPVEYFNSYKELATKKMKLLLYRECFWFRQSTTIIKIPLVLPGDCVWL